MSPDSAGCLRTSDFDYHLPAGAIAQHARPRGTSRLLVLDRERGRLRVERFAALPSLLTPADLLLVNDVKVIPARLHGRRVGGGTVELLLVRPLGGGMWEAMARPAKRLRAGEPLALERGSAIPRRRCEEGRWEVEFAPPLDESALAVVGEVPLPPYIRRPQGPRRDDLARYQTVYARGGRAVAAPTAGLHFTPELLAAVAERGIELASVTLHVGPGTFRPVQADDPRDHALDREDYAITEASARSINRALAAGRRIVCVGTTACRTLEHAVRVGRGRVGAGDSSADLFILPPFRFRGTGALLTNFHQPRSTLLMLVSALAGREAVLAAYRAAVAAGFRFYSYGDAMLVL